MPTTPDDAREPVHETGWTFGETKAPTTRSAQPGVIPTPGRWPSSPEPVREPIRETGWTFGKTKAPTTWSAQPGGPPTPGTWGGSPEPIREPARDVEMLPEVPPIPKYFRPANAPDFISADVRVVLLPIPFNAAY